MSVLAHSSRKEKIQPSLQGPWPGAWKFHPLRMLGKIGSSFPLTFFVVFCHAHLINAQEVAYNTKISAAETVFNQAVEISFTAHTVYSLTAAFHGAASMRHPRVAGLCGVERRSAGFLEHQVLLRAEDPQDQWNCGDGGNGLRGDDACHQCAIAVQLPGQHIRSGGRWDR